MTTVGTKRRAGAAKISISLPQATLDAVETGCRESNETVSQFIRRAIEDHLRRERERDDIAQYVRAYREHPETEAEVRQAQAIAVQSLAAEPWE